MAYKELIKDFERIRDYMREFYVYGFKTRSEYDAKSMRSYDNERRRIESWLGEYMSFRQNPSGKKVFLSLDSQDIPHNPLYQAFKAKSFTDNDITFHFYVLDLLLDSEGLTVREIMERLERDYAAFFDRPLEWDESTVRKKLKEYVRMGLVTCVKCGRELSYFRSDHEKAHTESFGKADRTDPGTVEDLLEGWKEAVAFFSEADQLGVIGSYLLDKFDDVPGYFRFKHHYILHALESEVLYDLLVAIDERKRVLLTISVMAKEIVKQELYPLRIYVSTQNGRRYLMGYHYGANRISFVRLDNIRKLSQGEPDSNSNRYAQMADQMERKLWGVSIGKEECEHVELTLSVEAGEGYILNRLEREKRNGRIEALSSGAYRFVADVSDAMELMPWVRTFLGRIKSFTCSNAAIEKLFHDDLKSMERMYGCTPADCGASARTGMEHKGTETPGGAADAF